MSVEDHDSSLTDEKSFQRLGSGQRRLAKVYFWLQLDLLIDFAYALSCDFFARPQLYRDLSDSTTDRLVALHFRYGASETFPSHAQRNEFFAPIFGSTSADAAAGQFSSLRDSLFLAVCQFRQRPAGEGAPMLRKVVTDRARLLQDWLHDFSVPVTKSIEHAMDAITEKSAYPILRDATVTTTFGVPGGIELTWPYARTATADKFLEELSAKMRMRYSMLPPVTRAGFGNLHETARSGVEAIAAVLAIDPAAKVSDEQLERIVSTSYVWFVSIQSLGTTEATVKNNQPAFNALNRPPYSAISEPQTGL